MSLRTSFALAVLLAAPLANPAAAQERREVQPEPRVERERAAKPEGDSKQEAGRDSEHTREHAGERGPARELRERMHRRGHRGFAGHRRLGARRMEVLRHRIAERLERRHELRERLGGGREPMGGGRGRFERRLERLRARQQRRTV